MLSENIHCHVNDLGAGMLSAIELISVGINLVSTFNFLVCANQAKGRTEPINDCKHIKSLMSLGAYTDILRFCMCIICHILNYKCLQREETFKIAFQMIQCLTSKCLLVYINLFNNFS